MSKKSYAPIILFTYRRLATLKKVITSLNKNKLSKKTEICIFSDGYKNLEDKQDVLKVRKYLNTIGKFKKVKLFFRKKNIGLAKNIIQGTTKILSLKKKGIILEDDIIVSVNFLIFMNSCLDKFKDVKKVWHINSWNYNIKNIKSKEDVFYWRGMHCWGWATWLDKWKHYEKNPKKLLNTFTDKDIKKFNYDGNYNFWQQVIRNYKLKINSWAIFWYATIHKNKGLCVSPRESLTFNIGNDNYASNTLKSYDTNDTYCVKKLHKKSSFRFQTELSENIEIYNQIKRHLKLKKIKNLFLKFTGLKKIINFN